jgi:cytoskeletal protein CcmA (bactofilin family)
MKFRKDQEDGIESILAEGVQFQGELTFSRGLRVDGIVRGKVRSEACLMVGPTGKVEAEVHIQRAMINGEFRGILRAAERVEIHKEGRVYGDLYTPCLIIEAGAVFDGKCNMTEERSAAAEPNTAQRVDKGEGADRISTSAEGGERHER